MVVTESPARWQRLPKLAIFLLKLWAGVTIGLQYKTDLYIVNR